MIYQSNKVWYSPQKGLAKSFRKDCSESQRICFKPWKDLANPSFYWSKHEATLNSAALGAVSKVTLKEFFTSSFLLTPHISFPGFICFLPGTYFNCIMFMVASSVVTTIMILNYHHRLADTHEMPEWVRTLWRIRRRFRCLQTTSN